MDPLFKAIATAAFVAGLLLLLRQAGPRAGGLAAALPVTSAPALFWLGVEQGSSFAAHAAAAALLTTALTPLLVTVYGRLSPQRRPLACLLASLAAATAGLLTLVIGLLARQLSAGPCGLLAAVPVVGLSTLCSMHRQQGAAEVCRFLVGYVEGNAAKAAFLALLAVAIGPLPLGCAWAAAAGTGLLTLGLLRLPLLQRLYLATA